MYYFETGGEAFGILYDRKIRVNSVVKVGANKVELEMQIRIKMNEF